MPLCPSLSLSLSLSRLFQAKYKYTAGSGVLTYLPTEHCLEWTIDRFPGNASLVLKAEINMMASIKEKAWSRPPIILDFQVPMYTASGLHVRFLKVFEKCTRARTHSLHSHSHVASLI